MAEKIIDVAMESTSQEILEKLGSNDVNKLKFASKQYDGQTTDAVVLSVTGRGRLHGVGAKSGSATQGRYQKVTIIIDGVETSFTLTHHNTSTACTSWIFIGKPEHFNQSMLTTGGGFLITMFSTMAHSVVNYSTKGIKQIVPFETTSVTAGDNESSWSMGCFLGDYIEFEESLVIKYSTTTTGTQNLAECGCLYSLEG